MPSNKTKKVAGPVMRREEAMSFVGLRDTQFDLRVATGDIPSPVKITEGGRTVVWLRSELEAWLAQRVAKRDEKKAASK